MAAETQTRRTALGRKAAALTATLVALALLAGCAGRGADAAPTPTAEAAAAMELRAAPAPSARPAAQIPNWRWYFDDISKGAILVNIEQRWLIYWQPGGGAYNAFPIAVPIDDDLERTGLTRIVRKRENPDWRPTPSMIARNPDLPRYIGPGPHNPLGEHALYLGWTYYAIHGTNDPGAIGTRATAGCFRLEPKDIAWLYERVEVGTPVMVVDDIAS